jgi:hypothetical protein
MISHRTYHSKLQRFEGAEDCRAELERRLAPEAEEDAQGEEEPQADAAPAFAMGTSKRG